MSAKSREGKQAAQEPPIPVPASTWSFLCEEPGALLRALPSDFFAQLARLQHPLHEVQTAEALRHERVRLLSEKLYAELVLAEFERHQEVSAEELAALRALAEMAAAAFYPPVEPRKETP